MSHPSDNSLDARLRDVSVPPGMTDRIKASLVPSNEELDEWLRRVPVPESLAIRLHDVPDDIALDERLTDVPAPAGLAAELRRVSLAQRVGRRARQLVELSLAALWFLTLSMTILAAVGALLSAVVPQPGGEGLIAVGERPRPESNRAINSRPLFVALETLPLEELNSPYRSANPSAARLTGMPIDGPELGNFRRPGAVEEWSTLVEGGLRPLDDVMLLRFGVLGSPQYADDRLPEIDSPLVPRAVGIQPPLVRGYDRRFFLKHRLFPPLSPAASPQLASLAVPLVTESDVLSRLARSLAEDRLPPASELRIEDFLAAMNYRFAPAPAGRVALRTAAGPSPFGSSGSELLQIGVQAGGLDFRTQDPTHLVLAIDLSQSMNRGGRLEMVQQGLDRLLAQLGENDRISLVVFDEEIVHRVELATRDDAPAIRQLLAALSPRGGTNLAAGIQAAVSVAMTNTDRVGGAQRLVLITDSQAQLPAATLQQLDELLLAAREAGMRLDVIDVGERETLDPVLAEWAARSGGEARQIRQMRQLYWSLLEALAGAGPVIASEAKLTVQFNPQAVTAYRLIGHEANALADLAPASVQAELAAGEAATALFELWLAASDSDDVAVAELTWRDAAGNPQRVRQRISRLQFAPTFGESALSLQQAAIAAEAGQELTGARDALREVELKPANTRGLAGIAAKARTVNQQVSERPDFQRLLELVNRLDDRR